MAVLGGEADGRVPLRRRVHAAVQKELADKLHSAALDGHQKRKRQILKRNRWKDLVLSSIIIKKRC
jgi:hypothetical protein